MDKTLEQEKAAHLLERLSKSKEKLAGLHLIEVAMVDFYFEIVNWDEDRRESTEERRQVRQRASQDFVAVFADLRRRIRQLLASKEDESIALKKLLDAKQATTETFEHETNTRVKELKTEIETLNEDLKNSAEKIQILSKEKDIVTQSCEEMVLKTQKECNVAKNTILEMKDQIPKLKQQLENVVQSGFQKDMELRQIPELKKQLTSAERKNKMHEHAIAKLIERQSEVSIDEVNQLGSLRAETQRQKDEIRRYREQVAGFRRNFQVTKLLEAKNKEKRAMELEKTQREKLRQAQDELKHANAKLAHQASVIKKMKMEYAKLYKHVKGSQPTILSQDAAKCSDAKAKQIANENPYVTDYFKQKLHEQSNDMRQIKKRFRHVLSSEFTGKTKLLNLEKEKGVLAQQTTELRYKVDETAQKLHVALGQSSGRTRGELASLQRRNTMLEQQADKSLALELQSEYDDSERPLSASKGSRIAFGDGLTRPRTAISGKRR